MTLALPTALVSADRSPNISEASDLYGFLVGSWHLEVRSYAGVDVTGRNLRGEVHAARVLEGRGIQDTWIMPPRGSRTGLDPTQNMYGTTLRLWDSSIQAWRIAWSNPASNHYEQQIGRAHGKDIVQLGVRPNGTTTRWMFVEITPRSFHWLGDALGPDGATWLREAEFLATRA
ncbi:MAG: hypothetical protein E6J90_23145 [Deltaproteobacteria bacterium]|nr:MAG: hypothetical protein E6J91_26585 [Deltaproteobacteria bacterium]TMQ16838.1 MAG: hypothetical protein E6J90_23145 [Deltaproteobacteria bacterium]